MLTTTLLITTFNRGHLLNNTLERLCNITIPDDILIVDDGGIDNTKDVVERFKTKLPIRYIYNNNPEWTICSMARNIGVKNTDADIIITSEPELLWITDIYPQMIEERKKYPNEIISAGVIYHAQERTSFNPGLITDPVSALVSEIVEDYVTEPRPYHPAGYCRTKNMQATFACLYERQWLLDLGGWDEAFPGPWGWDDIELATRLRISGINQHVCSHMEAIHQWHPHLPPHIQGPGAKLNEDYFISKRLDLITNKNDAQLIANKGKKWGKVKP